jgi:hypothetical protein
MLSERSEKQRPVILNPKIPLVLDEITKTVVTFIQGVRLCQVFVVEPLLVASAYGGFGDRAFALDAEEEVDGGLFVGIWKVRLGERRPGMVVTGWAAYRAERWCRSAGRSL